MQGPEFSDLPPDRPTVYYRDEGHSRVMRRIAPLRMLLSIALTVSASLLVWTIATRPQPFEPALVYFGVVVVPLGLYVLHHSTVRNLRALQVFLLLATLYGAPFLAWNTSMYRGVVFALTWWALPDQSLMRTLDDPSDWVGAMACERALRNPTLPREEAILPVLQFRPALAERCLRGVGARQPELGHKLARHVTTQWYRAWMNSSILPTEYGCEAAEAFASVSTHRGDNGAAHLLHCALGAERPAVGQCCADALDSNFSAAQLPEVDPYRIAAGLRSELFYLVSARLASVQGGENPSERAASKSAQGGKPLMENPTWLLHWTVTLGCHLVEGDHRPDHMAAELAMMTFRECNLDVQDTLFPSETTRLMRRTCEPINASDWFGQIDPYEWCAGVRSSAVHTAIDAASFRVAQGIVNLEYRGLAESIYRGVARRDRARYMQGPIGIGDLRRSFDDGLYGSDIVAPRRPDWTQTSTEAIPQGRSRDPSRISLDSLTRDARRQGNASRNAGDDVRAQQLDSIVEVLEARRRESKGSGTTMGEAFRRYDAPPQRP